MSGHSHWANIKGKKEANDAQKGKLFSKVTREIMLAISQANGDTDPNSNIKLRYALDKAKEVSMPRANVDRLITRIKERGERVEEVIYEAILANGVNLIIKTTTDNPNRTHGELGSFLDKNGGKLVAKGSVSYLFDYCGQLFLKDKPDDEALQIADQLGADDLEKEDDGFYLYVPYENLSKALKEAETLGLNQAPELVYRAKSKVTLDETGAEKIFSLIEKLEEFDDVQVVFTNVA